VTRLDALYLEHGQSPWLDNLRRDWLRDGTLAGLVDRGVRGVTSNPSIFAKAIAGSDLYDETVNASKSSSAEEIFEELAINDVQDACDLLATVHAASKREFTAGVRRYEDGFVSLEVSPRLAYDTAATISAAKRLWKKVDRENLMIKIPATPAGLGAISATLAEGINVNVTLIFSLERYREVLNAYIEGVRDASTAGHNISSLASVASFFVSRVDTAVDPQLDKHPELRGSTAISQVGAAYQIFLDRFDAPDARELLAAGAQVQRPLWASTSTKNPDYDQLLYVQPLVGNETVNTMPDATLDLFATRGEFVDDSIANPTKRAQMINTLQRIGEVIDLATTTQKLEHDGVKAFDDSYSELLASVEKKIAARPQ
jgi:transaldolase